MMQSKVNTPRLRRNAAILLLVLIPVLGGCSVAERLGKSDAAPVAAAVLATPIPTPSPVVVSTPANTAASAESAVAGSGGATRRLSTTNMTYNGEIMADTVVPVVAQVAGQIQEVRIAVGDSVKKGDLLVRVDSTVAEAQRAQAQAALQLAQSQLE